MTTTTQCRRVITLILAVLLALLAGPSHAQFVAYDDFSSGTIDPDKWLGRSGEGSTTAPTAKAQRTVENGALRLALTSWGNNTSNSGFVTTRERFNMKQFGTLGGTGFITGMKALVTVLAVDVQDCPANPDTGDSTFSSLRARAELNGWFFNDGSGSAGNTTGNIIASFKLYQGADGAHRIEGGISRCSDATCSATTNPVPGAAFSTLWALDTPLTLQFVWDAANGKFTFTVTNPQTLATEAHDVVYQGTVTNAGPPINAFNALGVQNSVKNCGSTRKRVAIDALFDDVQVQRQP